MDMDRADKMAAVAKLTGEAEEDGAQSAVFLKQSSFKRGGERQIEERFLSFASLLFSKRPKASFQHLVSNIKKVKRHKAA